MVQICRLDPLTLRFPKGMHVSNDLCVPARSTQIWLMCVKKRLLSPNLFDKDWQGEVEVAGIKPTNDYPSNLRPKDMPARVCIKIKISLAHEVGKGCKSKDSQIMSRCEWVCYTWLAWRRRLDFSQITVVDILLQSRSSKPSKCTKQSTFTSKSFFDYSYL